MQKEIHGFSVSHFFETYREKLKMELLVGEAGLHRLIHEATINRPALALTGFFKYFAHRRVQVLGAAEMTYIRTLPSAQQRDIFEKMVKRGIPCLVLTRNYQPTPAMLAVATELDLPLIRTPMITMNWINFATLAIDNEFAPRGYEHATMLDVKGVGVMIRGASGVGKSECALALIERGHSLVADDYVHTRFIDERELLAMCRAQYFGYMEVRGIGIINIAEMFGVKSVRMEKRIDLVVTLKIWTEDAEEDRTGLDENFYPILGQQVPHIELHVRPGRDIARLVEVAALTQSLKKLGHDPAKKFNEQLIAHMAKQPVEPPATRIKPVERD
jgi:HPr kinase/phosphorylase